MVYSSWSNLISRRGFLGIGTLALSAMLLGGCTGGSSASSSSADAEVEEASGEASSGATASSQASSEAEEVETFVQGTMVDRGFIVDDVLQSSTLGDIHFSMHVPDGYDGTRPYALYVHVAGFESWFSNGLGNNLWGDFVFVANGYIDDMIVITPQLSDWHDTSANMVIALTEWAMNSYNIDEKRIYLSGYSFGGDTISLVMGKRPELYRRVLHMASRWDGDVSALVAAKVPVRMVIGDADEYYSTSDAQRVYGTIRSQYEEAGLSEGDVNELVMLDVKSQDYFQDRESQHSDGAELYAHDSEIMGWLFR